MNTLPGVFSAGGISAAILGFQRTAFLMFMGALFISLYTNYSWNKIFKTLAKALAAKK